MKRVLIIYPHWPPSNLAGVHRPRLIANFLAEFDWQPIVLTVHEKHYEEPPDPDLCRTVRDHVIVYKTDALPVIKLAGLRLVGDIGIRGFISLYRAALKIIKEQKVEFLWIPIPSWYCALLGRLLHAKTGIKYGIDYIDPWVVAPPKDVSPLSRAAWTYKLARVLEPIAVKHASLISGVATSYYEKVLERRLKEKQIAHLGMPYGFDPRDHEVNIKGVPLPWKPGESALVYAGAFLPGSELFIELLFSCIRQLKQEGKWAPTTRLYFIGTGTRPHGRSISEFAADYEITDVVTEISERMPFLHVLHSLSKAAGVMVIGSTARHYTASKTFQALLSQRPVFSIFHKDSSALQVMQECRADDFTVAFDERMPNDELRSQIMSRFTRFVAHDSWAPKLQELDRYSARESARELAEAVNSVVTA